MEQFIGLDLGDVESSACVVDEAGRVAGVMSCRTERREVRKLFRQLAPSRVCLEVGPVSAWVSVLLEELGHEVVACNPRRLRLVAESTLKCDRLDAETLARLARLSRLDAALLPAVRHRGEGARKVRALLRVRLALLGSRTALVNTARSLARTLGQRLPGVTPGRLPEAVAKARLPKELKDLLAPLLEAIEHLTERLRAVDARVEELAAGEPVVERLRAVPGVGALTALAYRYCLEDPGRFARSRDVGPYLGLRPRLRQSGTARHEGHITREGDGEMRRLLVQAAHVFLRTQRDSHLRRWAQRLERRVGKKKAVTALARKLAVLMHRLWVGGEEYQPFYRRQQAA
jgi:transposase